MSFRKCGTCVHFFVKPNEIEVAQHAPHISACQPGMPHCLGGQVRGACGRWDERAELGMPMPWGDGPLVESTFGCKLWERGGPSVKQIGSFNADTEKVEGIISSVSNPIAAILGVVSLGVIKGFTDK